MSFTIVGQGWRPRRAPSTEGSNHESFEDRCARTDHCGRRRHRSALWHRLPAPLTCRRFRARRAGPRRRRAAAAARSSASRRLPPMRPRLVRRGGRHAGPAHRRVRGGRRHRPRRAHGQDRGAVPHDRRADRAVAGHHADPRWHRHRHARRRRPAHPRAPGRGRVPEVQRPGLRRDLHRRRATTSSSITARSPGRPTRTFPPPARASPAARPTNGARARPTASRSATTSSPRAWPTPRTRRASIRRAR